MELLLYAIILTGVIIYYIPENWQIYAKIPIYSLMFRAGNNRHHDTVMKSSQNLTRNGRNHPFSIAGLP